uniref:Signal peptide peptidase n=2 Tax=Rhodosorus marinus TaxID=101924 RepID=A0A7S3A0E0_9RHOD|mmetsp:Transcript_3986/g.16865  ORF Transcript_3986/g.16865 Transcript_3986/m.16865 type:complete len:380 (+) Transcript_3986:98-1237(+)
MSTPQWYPLVETPAYVMLATLILLPTVVTVPVYVQMIGISTLIIFLGSARAVDKFISQKAGDKSVEPREVIKRASVFRFPIVASCTLVGLFLAFKYLPKKIVSFCLTFGSLSLATFNAAFMYSGLMAESKMAPKKFTEPIPKLKKWAEISPMDILCVLATIPVAAWYWYKKHWLPNNVLSTSLALTSVEAMALVEFQSAAILLCGLFFYDIFWVFGSTKVFGDNVMVSVAKQFDGPIKLVFPRFPSAGPSDQSMLGLGDIVIPGFFIALILRYDAERFTKGLKYSEKPIFFYTVLVFYFLGLASTYLALLLFHAAQPALLYLVPACLLSVLVLAASLGELKDLLMYAESEEGEVSEKKNEEEAEGNNSVEGATEPKKTK